MRRTNEQGNCPTHIYKCMSTACLQGYGNGLTFSRKVVGKGCWIFFLHPSLYPWLSLRLLLLTSTYLYCTYFLDLSVHGNIQYYWRRQIKDVYRNPTLFKQHLAIAWSSSFVLSGSCPATIRTGFTAKGSPVTMMTTSMAFCRKLIFASLSWQNTFSNTILQISVWMEFNIQ